MPARFRPGRVIRTVPGAVRMIVDGRWLYFRGKPLSPSFIGWWPVLLLTRSVRAGSIRAAVSLDAKKEADDASHPDGGA